MAAAAQCCMNLPDLTCSTSAGWKQRRASHPWATLWMVLVLYLRLATRGAPATNTPIQARGGEKSTHRAWPLQEETFPRTSNCSRQPHTHCLAAGRRMQTAASCSCHWSRRRPRPSRRICCVVRGFGVRGVQLKSSGPVVSVLLCCCAAVLLFCCSAVLHRELGIARLPGLCLAWQTASAK